MTSTPITKTRFTDEQRAAWEERRRQQQRLQAIFDPERRRRDGLNVEAIGILIGWAEQDENYLAQFRLNGTWEQGTWGTVHVPEDVFDPDGYDEEGEVKGKALREASDKAILNGVCQTSYCMAGQTVAQAGFSLNVSGGYASGGGMLAASAETCTREEFTGKFDERGWPIMEKVGKRVDISTKAGQILGLNNTQEDYFFNGSNTIRDLKEYANTFADEAGLPLLYPDFGTHSNYEARA